MVARGQVAGEGHGGPQPDDDQRGDRACHPLDPLDACEISQAVEILRRERLVTPGARFVSVSLNEPVKSQVPFAAPAHEGGDVQRGGDDADAVAHDLRGDQEGIHVRVLLLRTMFGSGQAFWMTSTPRIGYIPTSRYVCQVVSLSSGLLRQAPRATRRRIFYSAVCLGCVRTRACCRANDFRPVSMN